MPDLENLRVTFVAGTLGRGGAEQQLYYILAALRERGALVDLLCLTRGEFWEERIARLGVPVTWVGRSGSRVARLGEIVRALRRRRPDVLQSQHFYTNLYAVGAARALGLREVCAIRNDVFSEVAANGRIMGPMSLRAPRAIAANSRAAIRNALRLGARPERLHLLPNVVDTDRFAPGRRNASGGVTLVAAGRLTRAKRFDRYLRIVARLRDRAHGATVRALLVGDGPDRAGLERLAAELGLLPEAVRFTGGVENMAGLYSEADVFVLTSEWEGTPNVVLEAMAAGLPVVSNVVGGVPEVMTDGETGLFVDASREEQAAAALEPLVASPELRAELGARARRHVETSFSLRRLPSLLDDVYRAALA